MRRRPQSAGRSRTLSQSVPHLRTRPPASGPCRMPRAAVSRSSTSATIRRERATPPHRSATTASRRPPRARRNSRARGELLRGRLGAIHDVAERGFLRPILRVPPEVLARDAHARLLAVERVQRRDVLQQHRSALRGSTAPAAARPSRGSARSRERSTAGPARRGRSSSASAPVAASTARALCGESTSPFAMTGIATLRLIAAIVVVLRLALVVHVARAAVHRERARCPRPRRAARSASAVLVVAAPDPVRIFSVTGTSTARHDAGEDARDERLVREQRGPRPRACTPSSPGNPC